MTASTAASEALGWAELAPLHSLLDDVDGEIRAAAAEAAARLPLSQSAWERAAPVLSELLETTPSLGVAQAAAHAPLGSLRQQLRAVAADGGHPGQHVASVALSEVGDDTVLAADVARLLARPLTDHTAMRLAGLPLERLAISSDGIPQPSAAGNNRVQSLCTAIAAARLGDTDRLDRLLDLAESDPTVVLIPFRTTDIAALLAASASLRTALRSVLPLPTGLLAHLDRRLSTSGVAHVVLRSLWLESTGLESTRRPTAPRRLDDFTDPLAGFVDAVRRDGVRRDRVRRAGDTLVTAAMRLGDAAPDPQPVYRTWLRVAESAPGAWPQVAWTLSRAGAGALVSRLAPWLAKPESALAACHAVRDAAGWSTASDPPDAPLLVFHADDAAYTQLPVDERVLPAPEQPPWPRPTELIDPTQAVEATPADPWAEDVPSFD